MFVNASIFTIRSEDVWSLLLPVSKPLSLTVAFHIVGMVVPILCLILMQRSMVAPVLLAFFLVGPVCRIRSHLLPLPGRLAGFLALRIATVALIAFQLWIGRFLLATTCADKRSLHPIGLSINKKSDAKIKKRN